MSETTEPMTQEVNHVELLEAKDLSTDRFLELRSGLFGTAADRRRVKKFTVPYVETGAASITDKDLARHVGLCLAAIGEHDKAIEFLEKGNSSRPSQLSLAKSRLALRKTEDALADLTGLHKENPGDLPILRTLLEAHEQNNDLAGFETTFKGAQKTLEGTADFSYCEGFIHDKNRRFDAAMLAYKTAIDNDPVHVRALFRLAYRSDMAGLDDDALYLYERCAKIKPTYAAVYMNLGIIYDDLEEYQQAIDCFQALLDLDPQNKRARLFMKDSVASLDMYYDEDQERREDKLNQILKIPVTDFELSVRSRNCLERMKIRTLGDLIRKTEPELLSYKNFGETSLAEIKEILTSKSLKLGMGRDELERSAGTPNHKIEQLKAMITGIGTPTDDLLSRPISELELSVRSRRCMTRLGIQTLGELVSKSEEELMSTRNFGQTSLVETREKLRNFGLSLKGSS